MYYFVPETLCRIESEEIVRCVAHLGQSRKHTFFVFILPSCAKRLDSVVSSTACHGLVVLFVDALSVDSVSRMLHIFWVLSRSSAFGQLFSEIDQKTALSLLASIKPGIMSRVISNKSPGRRADQRTVVRNEASKSTCDSSGAQSRVCEPMQASSAAVLDGPTITPARTSQQVTGSTDTPTMSSALPSALPDRQTSSLGAEAETVRTATSAVTSSSEPDGDTTTAAVPDSGDIHTISDRNNTVPAPSENQEPASASIQDTEIPTTASGDQAAALKDSISYTNELLRATETLDSLWPDISSTQELPDLGHTIQELNQQPEQIPSERYTHVRDNTGIN